MTIPALTQVTRVFVYGGRTYQDPDPAMTPAQVKDFYAGVHPELVNATVEGGEFDGATQTFTFTRAVGTKG